MASFSPRWWPRSSPRRRLTRQRDQALCFLTDTDDFAAFNEEYAAYFGDVVPTRSTVGVALAGGYRFEIEAVALVSTEE
jgi:hypothetical protein